MISCKPCPQFLSTTFVWIVVLVTLCKGNPDPTDGFTAVPLKEVNFNLQRPYNVPPNERYSFENGVRQLWVFSNDKPFKIESNTKPRTEIRITGNDYSNGVWQFEGYMYIPKGTTGAAIMQIVSREKGASFQLRVYDGQLKYINRDLIEDNINDKWFRVNVIHTFGESISVFINGTQKYAGRDDSSGAGCYFKFGVYTQEGSSNCMESRWKDVQIYKKS